MYSSCFLLLINMSDFYKKSKIFYEFFYIGLFVVFLCTDKSGSIQLCPSMKPNQKNLTHGRLFVGRGFPVSVNLTFSFLPFFRALHPDTSRKYVFSFLYPSSPWQTLSCLLFLFYSIPQLLNYHQFHKGFLTPLRK